jgi:two-component system, LytTR family, sensor kinase
MNVRARFWVGYWGAWALFSLYMASMDLMRQAPENFFLVLIPMNLLQNAVWGCAGLVVLAMARRWPITRFNRANVGNWAVHLFGTVLIAAVSLWFVWLLSVAFAPPAMRTKAFEDPLHTYYGFFSMYFHINLLLMWAVLGAYHGARILGQSRKQELEAVQLESRLAMAQNRALQMQMQPHFLFNTLNSISALIHSDGEAADQMVSRLADLLRMTLDSGADQEILLRQEMAFTDAYLNIEAIRFQDRLTVKRDVPETCLDALVPAFLLQPLVENAIKHGVADIAGPATIEIRARHEADWLILEVIDNGRGLRGDSKRGIGTQNTATRLQLMYKNRHVFDLCNLSGGGTKATVRLPWSSPLQQKLVTS